MAATHSKVLDRVSLRCDAGASGRLYPGYFGEAQGLSYSLAAFTLLTCSVLARTVSTFTEHLLHRSGTHGLWIPRILPL